MIRGEIRGELTHPVLGKVCVTFSSSATKFTARWKGQRLHLTSPIVDNVKEAIEALDSMASDLLALRPPVHSLRPGKRLNFDGFYLLMLPGRKPGVIRSELSHDSSRKPGVTISLGGGLDPADPDVIEILAKHVRHAARYFSPALIEEARAISARVGVAPDEWLIGRGAKTLGHCSSTRKITLSCMCVYLPYRLREYIICHELAHLTHFDHSAAFHALCSHYCGGDGNARRAELKAFVWPVPR